MTRVIKTKVEIEGKIHEETVVIEEEEPSPWQEGREFKVVGRGINRIDARERVTGAARYTYDVALPGMLFAAVLRSPHPHARIVSVDACKAESLPGVRAILTKDNAPDIRWYGVGKLLDSTVRFVGEEVAVVAADDLDTAQDALRLIDVQYEVLPALIDMEQASRPGAPQIHPSGNVLKSDGKEGELYSRGDVQRGFKQADVIVEGTFTTSTQLHNSFETHGSVASWEGDELTIWEFDAIYIRSARPGCHRARYAIEPRAGDLRVHGRRLRQQRADLEAAGLLRLACPYDRAARQADAQQARREHADW